MSSGTWRAPTTWTHRWRSTRVSWSWTTWALPLRITVEHWEEGNDRALDAIELSVLALVVRFEREHTPHINRGRWEYTDEPGSASLSDGGSTGVRS